ncbi:MAG: hypothetical protein GTN80_01040, partial [Nitrososphaeria archaeon]|nr:hypothetical protein [Nitrososphaeria archaeon]
AESYEVREEGRVYEIKIREDVFWHDDQPIVAADVEKTFSQDPAFSEVKLEVVSDKLVRFKL